MYRKEVNEKSPLRILEASTHGGLGRGNLGVVMSRAGVGKTACLVQIALDDLMRDRKVLHLAGRHGQTVAHVQSWYDALFDDMATLTNLEDRETVRASVARNRIIRAGERIDGAHAIEKVVALFSTHLDFTPDAIVVDGFPWEDGTVATTAAALGALKGCAQRLNAELWLAAQTHRDDAAVPEGELPQPCHDYHEIIDVALLLEPESDHVRIRLLKDHNNAEVSEETTLQLQCDTMRLVVAGTGTRAAAPLPAGACTLLSGAAQGAEAEFGACAEKWGLDEINYAFEGKPVARRRGVQVLDDEALRRGAVSDAYLTSHMHRTYPKTELFRKILSSIWHQVNTASEVFVVGVILEDGTVKGGTGWAAELAKHLTKPVWVFDQEKRGWFTWAGTGWSSIDPPVIHSARFTGTGTRYLSDDGKAAIGDLFERSFGA